MLRTSLDRFVTIADPDLMPQLVASTGIDSARIDARVGVTPRFVYETPISRPLTYDLEGDDGDLKADGDCVLAFGMVEATPSILRTSVCA